MGLSTLAKPAYGTLLQMCSDAYGTAPTDIAELKDYSTNYSNQIEDVSVHNGADRSRRKIATMFDPGKTDFAVNWVGTDPTHQAVLAVLQSGEERTFFIRDNQGGADYQFNALIADLKENIPVAGVRGGSISLACTGPVDFDA